MFQHENPSLRQSTLGTLVRVIQYRDGRCVVTFLGHKDDDVAQAGTLHTAGLSGVLHVYTMRIEQWARNHTSFAV